MALKFSYAILGDHHELPHKLKEQKYSMNFGFLVHGMETNAINLVVIEMCLALQIVQSKGNTDFGCCAKG